MIINENSKSELFEKSYYSHLNRLRNESNQLLENTKAKYIIIFSGSQQYPYMDDNSYPYKANPYFIRWLPLLKHPNSYIILELEKKPQLIYFQEQSFWHKTVEDPDSYWVKYFDIKIIHRFDEIQSLLPSNKKECILITNNQNDDRYAHGIENINPENAINLLNYSRSIKTEYEIECLRTATKRAVKGHRCAEKKFKEGASEYEIHLAYCNATQHTENELPYNNIIAINENSSILHYQNYERIRKKNLRSFLIDAGATINGYASDITRTYAYEDNEYNELIKAFNEMQLSIVKLIKINMTFIELHEKTHEKIAEIIKLFNFAIGSEESLIKNNITKIFFPHGLGHFLGIQVHDVGGFLKNSKGDFINKSHEYPYLRLHKKIAIDQVFTIEPGFYIIDQLINEAKINGTFKLLNQKKLDWLKPYGGIRIEDNVRIMENGVENLTRDAFNDNT